MEERKLIELLERLLAVVSTNKAQTVFEELQLTPRILFAGLRYQQLPKLEAFVAKRLPRQLP